MCLSRALEHHSKDARELFPDAIVTKSNGNSVDISTILPSRVSSWINFLFFTYTANFNPPGGSTRTIWCGGFLGDGRNCGENDAVWKYHLVRDADDVAHETCMWSFRKGPKTQVWKTRSRKVYYELRPRFLNLLQETLTSTSTVTATETATATETVTFSVAVITFSTKTQ